MDLRTHPALQLPIRALGWFNARHPFSHNDHFHGWILGNLPERRARALDVGCGEGLLASRLAQRFDAVDAADRDEGMRAATEERGERRVRVIDGFDAADGPYDLITMIATLHHLELAPALERCRALLAPGGRLLVVGLAREGSVADAVWLTGSALANPVMGFLRHPIPTSVPRAEPPFPVRDPEHTVDQIAEAAGRILPGSTVRRRLPFRYTLEWTARPLP
ncbi:bifunctional 2-polyprenyl-6-hydroxyphenol methylase/3-demethylubiquinol 3-O-methyltransferase UbiG [Tsukamurella sp. 1534]|uniref:class I SAM-dependent methyltransferase n=1 Tax=Tsukamurella sp. 1534 TaxID=1151061 RepID=UPI0009DB2310|nr:class I SAM-dependent methyltransferase [Tsukamurella sp. 1534]